MVQRSNHNLQAIREGEMPVSEDVPDFRD